jgi:hypothetical protein
MRKTTSCRARSALAILLKLGLALTLSGCGESPPQGWQPPDRSPAARLLNHCPDLRGSWRLNPPALPGNQFKIGGTAVHAGTHPWETVTIEGDAAQSLQVTFGRSPESSELLWNALEKKRLTPKHGVLRLGREYRDSHRKTTVTVLAFQRAQFGWPVHSVQLLPGRDYHCEAGWLKGRTPHTESMPLRSMVAPWQVFGTAWFALDKQGQLIGRVDITQKRFISLWCGDGCIGFGAGTASGVAWGRWPRTQPAWQGEPSIPWVLPVPE